MSILIQQINCGHNHPWRAIPALEAMLFPETFLQGVKVVVFCESFNCGNFTATCLHGEHCARLRAATIE
jgi:hypothetical protein